MRFLMIGGFLGAGKTTTLARLARHYIDAGQKVALVTNDQAYGLVDTEALRSQGFDVGEVPGACFCCKFGDLVETVAALAEQHRPDIILAEPVGSCTDLAATVIRPLADLYGHEYEIAPLVVLCKPEHGAKILDAAQVGFSPKAAYVFLKQLEEAEVIVLNKIDKLQPPERDRLLLLLEERFPDKQILSLSAQQGEGFNELVEVLSQSSTPGLPALEIDYDTYAEGEAELGWLNATVKVTSRKDRQDKNPDEPWSLDLLVESLVEKIAEQFDRTGLEPGHVKVLGSSLAGESGDQGHGLVTSVANWVALGEPAELSIACTTHVVTADLLINARVASDPETIAHTISHAVDSLAQLHGLDCHITDLQHFSPARPEPTHRYS
ncbi:GTP-binding protein [Adhaeretor mobilis]|uniref:Metal chaperone YciC n=1 Tax=Adhaeretor mobilis TaxID=1930276 RepID=A0A517MY76_9BACT|nr:GTP-binding protein [Adhaeretor mobilis]QDS99824.1 Putative metal chaperone YciC [Adhaeretor mobilis]